MLIKALCDYSRIQEKEVEDGYCKQNVNYLIQLSPEGCIDNIISVEKSKPIKNKNGKEKMVLAPNAAELPVRTQKPGIDGNIIEHRPLYIFGLNYNKKDGTLSTEDKTDKAKKSHRAFCEVNLAFFEGIDSPLCRAYCNFIKTWKPEEHTGDPILLGLGSRFGAASVYYEFGFDTDKLLQDDPAFREAYGKYLAEKQAAAEAENTEAAVCSILGEHLPQARIHDKIKGIAGGIASGCVFVTSNENAFESYGKTFSFNSGVSEKAMKMYTSALNRLLADEAHHKVMDDLTLVYFAMKRDDVNESRLVSRLLTGADNTLNDTFAKALKGLPIEFPDIDERVDFYIAGLTANSSRVCQKFALRRKYGDIIDNIMEHQRNMAIGYEPKYISAGRMLHELVSPKSSSDRVPPPLLSGIFEAIFNGTNYPTSLLSTMIRRVKTDSDDDNNHFIKLNNARAGIIKACLIRNYKKEDIKMLMNQDNKEPAALCGRLFAVLEKIQCDSVTGDLNRTIGDTYFSSACSQPATIFPILMKLSRNHMRKLGKPAFIYYDKLLTELNAGLNDRYPKQLSLEDQGMFIVNYYQQKSELYTKKETKEKAAQADE